MSLNSFSFITCFFALLGIQAILQIIRNHICEKRKNILSTIQIIILFFASIGFMALADYSFCICLIMLTAVTYILAIKAEKTQKKIYVTVGAFFALLLLGYFKYCDFFVGNIMRFLGMRTDHFNIIIPLGISYYTFSSISYLVDVGRKKYPAERNPLYFALYMSFFPKITAGPIVRANDFLPQVHDYKGIRTENFEHGIQMFVIGLFKKMVLADHLAVFVNDVFYAPTAFHSITILLAVISCTLQLYFDFSGYSDMAIGISKILGFEICKNFNLPLISKSVSEYWRRWHISLGTWFKDYLFYPLSIGPAVKLRKRLLDWGVERKKTAIIANMFSLILVWVVTGLWHGADMTYIIWGLIQFVFIFYDSIKTQKKALTLWQKIRGWVVTTLVVLFGIVFFRAASVSNALLIFKLLIVWQNGIVHAYTWTFFSLIILIIGTIIAYYHSKKLKEREVNSFYFFADLHTVRGLTLFFLICGLTIIMGYYGNTAFVYGNF